MDDSHAIQAVRAGDRAAFGTLVDAHHRGVYRLCLGAVGSAGLAEELAHDAFVEAWRKLDQLREPDRFGPWLRAIALNLCRAHMRRRRPAPLQTGLEPPVPAVEPDASGNGELLARLADGLTRLSPAHRLVLTLHHLEGLTYDETAAFLDVPVGTVMSRLHRARRALKAHVAAEEPDKEPAPAMIPDPQFRDEVDAEIALLLEAFDDRREPPERLRVVLRRSPRRFAELIAAARETETRRRLALLLPGLGTPAARAAVACLGGGDPQAAANARAVLRRVGAGSTSPGMHSAHTAPSMHAVGKPLPGRNVYPLLEAVLDADLQPPAKAELIVEWMLAARDDHTAVLCTNVLLCFPDAAFALLAGRFRAFASPAELHASADVLHALCRTGRPFAKMLLPLLAGPPDGRTLVALAGAEALGRAVDQHWLADATDEQFDYEVRRRRAWAPLRSRDVGPDVLARLADRVAALVPCEQAETRNAALRTLGHLRAAAHAPAVRAGLTHANPATRMTAAVAAANLGDAEATGALLHMADSARPAERRAAVEALGRLGAPEALPVATRLIEDPAVGVQEAAVVAFATLGSDGAEATLEGLLTRGAKRRRIAAGKALAKLRKQRPGWRPEPSEAARKLRRRIRGDATPFTHGGLVAAVRSALPELRAYDETDLTRRLAAVCGDYAGVRRNLIDRALMTRRRGIYELTDLGRAVWRVEHFIREHYR